MQAAGGTISNAYALFAREQFASGTVYGILVAAATMVSVSHGTLNLAQVAAAVLVTVVVYWLAHAYSVVLGGQLATGVPPSWATIRLALIGESALVAVSMLPLIVMVIGRLLTGSLSTAISLALWFSVALLFATGLWVARRGQAAQWMQLLSGLVYAALGAAMVSLKVFIIH